MKQIHLSSSQPATWSDQHPSHAHQLPVHASTSLRTIVAYNGVLENASLIDLQRQKRITGDALLTYLIRPGTALYVGYTDRLENLGLYNGTVRPIGFPSTTTARQFFAKVSYLFRF
jgi:hypothetical protein